MKNNANYDLSLLAKFLIFAFIGLPVVALASFFVGLISAPAAGILFFIVGIFMMACVVFSKINNQ